MKDGNTSYIPIYIQPNHRTSRGHRRRGQARATFGLEPYPAGGSLAPWRKAEVLNQWNERIYATSEGW